MIDLSTLPFTFDKLIEAIKTKENFSLSRWGDGEWMCLLGYEGQNTDKHKYYEELGERLRDIIETGGDGELLALQSLALKDLGHLEEFNRLVEKNLWSANAEIFSRNHARDQELFNALSMRDIILVANKFLDPMVQSTGAIVWANQFVEIPVKNCWIEYERIWDEIQPKKNSVIIYCASMMANVLINELHSPDYTQIDLGSFLDPYVGRMTRRYHHKLEI